MKKGKRDGDIAAIAILCAQDALSSPIWASCDTGEIIGVSAEPTSEHFAALSEMVDEISAEEIKKFLSIYSKFVEAAL